MNRIEGTSPLARYEIASGQTILAGNLVALNSSGKAVAASDAANIKVVGVARQIVDEYVEVESGIIALANDTVSAITRANRGGPAYVKDKDTVSGSCGTNGVAAGIVVDVFDGEVYVDITPTGIRAAAKVMAPVRRNSVSCALGDRVIYPGKAGYVLVCTTAGTTDAELPSWPVSVTSGTTTLSDGTAVWTIYDAAVKPCAAATASALGLVKQAAAVADCTPAGGSAVSVETQLNALLAALRTAGVLADNAE